MFSGFGQTFFIAMSTGPIREAFDLTSGQYGGLYMIATITSAGTLPWLGQIVDRYSVAATIVFTAIMLAIACALLAFASNILLLLVALYGLRLFGQGMMTHISLTAMGKWFGANRGKAVSIASLGFQAAQALLPVGFVVLMGFVSWRQGWLISAAIMVFIALPTTYLLMKRERIPRGTVEPEAPDRAPIRQWTRSEMLRDHLFWVTCLGVLAPPFIGTAIFFHQDFMLGSKDWSLEVFAASIVVLTVVSTITSLIVGVIIDRKNSLVVLPTFLLPMGIACVALGAGQSQSTILVYMVVQGVGNGIVGTVYGSIWPEVYGTKHLGAIRSLFMSLMVLFSALGPGVMGWMIDWGFSFTTQMYLFAGWSFVGAIALTYAAKAYASRDNSPKVANRQ